MVKEFQKNPARLKVKCEDFIVEELAWGDDCKISEKERFNQKPDFSKLNKESKRDFLICEFEKKDIDNFRAKKEFASQIRKGLDALGFAGIKDKKAVTSQRVSIFMPDLELLENFSHQNIYIKNPRWAKRKIKLGYLEGNRFKVILREIDKKEAIKAANQIKKTTSFANYFGKQRFGSVRGNNAKIGYLLIKKKYKEAIETILFETSDKEREETRIARERLAKEKDYKKALDYFPQFLKFERGIISYLSENKDNFLGAIKKCERKTFLLYLHAIQSKIFNEILEQALFEDLDFTKKGQMKIPLFGYKSRIDEGKLGEIEENVLRSNKIELSDFKIQEIPYLSLKGDLRNALIQVKNINIEVEEDEIYPGTKKIILKFDLPSGVYATTFLENFFDLIEERT